MKQHIKPQGTTFTTTIRDVNFGPCQPLFYMDCMICQHCMQEPIKIPRSHLSKD